MKFLVSVILSFWFCSYAVAQSELNFKQPEANMYSGGQPSQNDLEQLKEKGVSSVINLRPLSEMDWDEQAFVESLGMDYQLLPIADASDISWENAEKLSGMLTGKNEEQVLLHCASGNRVGALIALIDFMNNKNVEQAIAVGRQWGMTRLEGQIAAMLESASQD
jgi:protein tyrosine phosphatase (PTP) superfamily phosphohydrolase (DUF442 family)